MSSIAPHPIDFEEPNPLVLIATPGFERLDATSAGLFREQVVAKIAGRTLVILDLERIEQIDSSGLAALSGVLKAASPGCRVRIVAASRSVRALLALTRLDRFILCFESIEELTYARIGAA